MKSSFAQGSIAAALALAFASAAQADMLSGAEGPGSIVMFGATPTASVMFDLGLTLDQFLSSSAVAGAPGTTIVWNFANNTVTETTPGGDYAGALTGAWSSAWSQFAAAAPSSRFGVIALDTTTSTYLSTTRSSETTVRSSLNSQVAGMNVVEPYVNTSRFVAGNTHETAEDGASYETDNTFASFHETGFGVQDRWFNKVPFIASQLPGTAADFYEIGFGPGLGSNPINNGAKLYAGTFSFDATAGTLTYQTAPIPEPSTYALMAAGMVLVAGLARRRRSAA